MYPDFNEILEELSYKVGIVDLTNESHKKQLVKLLRERGIDSAQQLADRASVVFEYIKENTPKPKSVLKEDDIVKSKASGNVYTVKTFDPSKHDKPTPDEIEKAKASNGGDLPTKDVSAASPQQSEPTQGQKLSSSDFQSSAEKDTQPTQSTQEPQSDFSELETSNKNTLDSFIKNGYAKSSGAPGSPGSMLNEIMSITSATDVLNSGGDFDYDSQLKSNIEKLKDTDLAKENDSDNPASGVKKSEAAEIAKQYGVSIGLASKSIIATRAAQSKTNHVKQAIIEKNGIENATSIPFFGDAKGLKSQEDAVNSTKGKILLGNTEITKEEATQIIRNSGGGENPSDTAIFVVNKNTGDLHMTFYSDKDNVNAIVAQSTIAAEVEFKKKQIEDFVQKGQMTAEQGEAVKNVMSSAIKEYQTLETDLDKVVNGPIIHLQSVNPNTLVGLAKTLSTGAFPDKYWKGDGKSVKGVAEMMSKSKKHMAYLPDGHATPPTDTEIMQGFVKYASDPNNTLTKTEQRVISDLSNKTDGPKLGAKLGEIRKRTVETDLNLIKKLDEQTVNINGTQVGIGTLLEAESVAEKLHLNIMFGGSGVYKDPDAFYQESGGVAVNKATMQKCLPFSDKNDMVSHFEVGEERETTKKGETTITGGSKIVYAISKNGQKYPIGEKIQRSKSGILGKLQTVYKYHPDVQKCFGKNG
jgi:hypothetical protein